MPVVLSGVSGSSGDSGWDNETKDPDKVKLISLMMSGHWTLLSAIARTTVH